MGKIKKLKLAKQHRTADQSLAHQIVAEDVPKTSMRVKERKRLDPEEHEKFVTGKLSEKILQQAREQQEELEDDLGESSAATLSKTDKQRSVHEAVRKFVKSKDSDDESEEAEDFGGQEYYEPNDLTDEDERALEVFMSKDAPARQTLADILRGKLTEKKTELDSAVSEPASLIIQKIDPAIIELYKGVRDVLQKYRSGRLPKAFKVVPKLQNWEQVLYITEPETWSAAAVFQATRLFASNLKERLAQRFYNLVLLPRIRDDIAEYKRLNFHLYQALRKALFKPGAFFKGFLLPLCESGNCSLREAVIVSSVLATHSILVLHSSAAILKIAEMEYSGANSVFLKTLFDKKYALPYRVIDSAVYHFIRFSSEKRKLPVLWHQSFLTFAQRYKEDLAAEQKEALFELTGQQFHYKISPEIRRELQNSKGRDVEEGIAMDTS